MYTLLFNFIRFLNLGFVLLAIHPKSALKKIGWFKSFRKKQVIDANNNAIPWWTYSFIDFISTRLKPGFKVLEFGCGNSTIYLDSKGLEVIALEDYKEWAEKIGKILKGKSKIISVNSIVNFDEYRSEITDQFDIIIIDNLGDRIKTAKENIQHLNESGVVIWDNTDGPDWPTIKDYMASQGFREISFTGMVPQELNLSKTTLFYRENNCLGI